ncbi:MAG: hypothetical protein OHK0021_19020 [Bryobacter sp.]
MNKAKRLAALVTANLALLALAAETEWRAAWIWHGLRAIAFLVVAFALWRERQQTSELDQQRHWAALLFALVAGAAFGAQAFDWTLAAWAALHLRLGRDALTKICWSVGILGLGGMLLDRGWGILPIGNRNHYAVFTEIVLPFLAWRARREASREALLAAALLLAASFAGGSRMGAALLGLELLWLAWQWGKAKVMALALAGLIALGSLFVLFNDSERLKNPLEGDHRLEIWASTIEMIRAKPWTGWGPDTFAEAYPAFAKFDNGQFVNAAHSDWLEWGVEAGLPGMLLPLFLLFWYLRKYGRSPAVWGILYGAIHAAVDYPWQRPGFVLLTALLAGAFTQYASQKTTSAAIAAESADTS